MKNSILRCHYGVVYDEKDFSFTIRKGNILATSFDGGLCQILKDDGVFTVPKVFAKMLSESIHGPSYLEVEDMSRFNFESVAKSDANDYKVNKTILKAIYLVEAARANTAFHPEKIYQIDIDVETGKITYADFDEESHLDYVNDNYDFEDVNVSKEALKRVETFLNL